MKRTIKHLVSLLLLIGVLSSGNLSYDEFITGTACPKIGIIPACYLVFICFIIPFIVHLLNKWNIVFFILTGLAFALAIFASVSQVLDIIQCPKTDMGIPMCYLSFLLLLSIIVGKSWYKSPKY